jgi:hypothetical protein
MNHGVLQALCQPTPVCVQAPTYNESVREGDLALATLTVDDVLAEPCEYDHSIELRSIGPAIVLVLERDGPMRMETLISTEAEMDASRSGSLETRGLPLCSTSTSAVRPKRSTSGTQTCGSARTPTPPDWRQVTNSRPSVHRPRSSSSLSVP